MSFSRTFRRAGGVLGLFVVLAGAARAQLMFTFSFNDTAGSGFNDATLGTARQAALASAASTLAGYFTGYNVSVNFTVTSISDSGSSTLASAGSGITGVNGFNKSFVQKRIQTGSGTSDGAITWNFGYSWALGDTVSGSQLDFKSVAMHELLHAMGFSSFISASGQGGFGHTSGTADAWYYYDQFLTTATGTRLVNTSFQYNTGGVGTLLTNGTGSDVYFSGANAMAANGGARVHLYSPASFVSGSSLSHLDTDFYGTNNYIMTHAVAYGPSVRTLSAIELGMLADLGYNVTAVPEPAALALGAGVVALGAALLRRRRERAA